MKVNILVPMAGKGQRFQDVGYTQPKQLIMAGDKHIIDWSMESVNTKDCNLIFVVRNEHVENFGIDQILKQKYGSDIKIAKVYQDTRGSVESCLMAREYIDNDCPLVIHCLDVNFSPVFNPHEVDDNIDGLILTFKSNSPNYSYSRIDEHGNVIEVVEKSVISNNANVGIYYFSKGKEFVEAADYMIENDITTKGEFYIAPLYNILVDKEKIVKIKDVETMHVMGTPRELDFFTGTVLNKFGKGKVALCCDHSGYELKEYTKKILSQMGINYIDFGSYTLMNCDQVDYTKLAAKEIQLKRCAHALGFCRTGQAINIAANKFKGIKSALIFDEYTAKYAIKHNGANFFCISSKYVDSGDIYRILVELASTEFEGGRHQIRVQKIEDIEEND